MPLSSEARREIQRMDRTRVILFAILIVSMLVIGWFDDYQSCSRSNPIRDSLAITYRSGITRAAERATVDHGLARQLDLQSEQTMRAALVRVHHLGCFPLPATK